MNPRAVAEAGESEARWMAGRPRGPLDGVPVTVKDIMDLAGFPTRRGSRITDQRPVAADAPVPLSLKEAGAVILGKTTTTEFGWKTPGDCPLHGITRNPWDRARTPGGSSSGAAAAAAAGFGALHVGTDAGGSIRIPAAYCGIVGVKPSYGRVPQWPHGAFAAVAVAGPMARTVRDSALMLQVMARPDARDPYATDAPDIVAEDETYLGKLSDNPYDPDSVSNPYGRYGSPYSSTSINNPYSTYGSPYSSQSPNNPYATQAPLLFGD
jgi:aspartyl-tRNA(Asn)/glutamyl-tRNA(Gln) amidotransferase subunit A